MEKRRKGQGNDNIFLGWIERLWNLQSVYFTHDHLYITSPPAPPLQAREES
jgi:hypothetical protein